MLWGVANNYRTFDNALAHKNVAARIRANIYFVFRVGQATLLGIFWFTLCTPHCLGAPTSGQSPHASPASIDAGTVKQARVLKTLNLLFDSFWEIGSVMSSLVCGCIYTVKSRWYDFYENRKEHVMGNNVSLKFQKRHKKRDREEKDSTRRRLTTVYWKMQRELSPPPGYKKCTDELCIWGKFEYCAHCI